MGFCFEEKCMKGRNLGDEWVYVVVWREESEMIYTKDFFFCICTHIIL